jgi:tRNA-dihydrouridine synthase
MTTTTTAPARPAEALRLGSLDLQSRALVAPMEAVSDVGYRRIVYESGAAITWTEMIRARGVVRNNKATLDLIDTFDDDTLTGIQLFVVNERELLDCLLKLEELAATTSPHFKRLRAVDLNFGCPSPDVIRVGAGPALLKRRSKLQAIFEALAKWKTTTTLPIGAISAKIRLGLNQQEQDHKVYLPVVELANDTLDYLVVHARHAKQRSRDKPTWNAIGEVKSKAKIPVIGNGDVRNRSDLERMRTQTGCDGVMVARAAIENPWVFRALSGRAPDARFTRADVDRAERAYDALATAHGTKEKFRAFHAEGFARLRLAADGKASRLAVPKNVHMDA